MSKFLKTHKQKIIIGMTILFVPGGIPIMIGYGIKSYLDRRNRNVQN